EVELLVPRGIVEGGEAARRRRRTAQHVDDDIHSPQAVLDGLCDGGATFDRREVGGDEGVVRPCVRPCTRGREPPGPEFAKEADNRAAHALGPAVTRTRKPMGFRSMVISGSRGT